MQSKGIALVVLLVLLFGCLTYLVLADCHDLPDGTCEDIPNDLNSSYYWDLPLYNTVKYKVNVTSHPSKENLTNNVNKAARKWNRIAIKNGNVAFG